MKQSWLMSNAETIAQNIVGQIIYFFILQSFGVEGSTSLGIQVAGFFAAYVRGVTIRRLFEWLAK